MTGRTFASATAAFIFCTLTAASSGHGQTSEPHGWLNTETLETRYGNFEFKNGYPVGDTASRLLDMQTLNRAIEVYTTQMTRVSAIALREGLRAFGATNPQQVVIWENLMAPRRSCSRPTLKQSMPLVISI